MNESNVVPFRHPGDMEAQFSFRPDVLGFEEVLVLFVEVREPGETDFTVIAHRYPGKRWINEKGWRVSGTQLGDKRGTIAIETVPELNDDDVMRVEEPSGICSGVVPGNVRASCDVKGCDAILIVSSTLAFKVQTGVG